MQLNIRTGSVSHGTMREEDSIPCFVDLLDSIREEIAAPGPTTRTAEETTERVNATARIDELLGDIERRMEGENYYASEESMWDMEALFDLLNEFAPAGHYFGAHPGDGADYGFWECERNGSDGEDGADDDSAAE